MAIHAGRVTRLLLRLGVSDLPSLPHQGRTGINGAWQSVVPDLVRYRHCID